MVVKLSANVNEAKAYYDRGDSRKGIAQKKISTGIFP